MNKKLLNKNFVLLLFGQGISQTGSFIYTTAIILFLKKLTDSGAIIGLNSMISILPVAIFGIFGGAFTDKFDKKKLLLFLIY